MKTRRALAVIVLTWMTSSLASSAAPTIEARPTSTATKLWLGDFELLLRHTAAVYANLEWTLAHYRIDPYELAAQTRARLANAASPAAAVQAVQEFLAAFRDPHVRSRPLAAPRTDAAALEAAGVAPLRTTLSGTEACQKLGVKPFKLAGFYYRLDLQPGYQAVPGSASGAFPAGVLPLGANRRLGIVRIPTFGDDQYPAVCAKAWERYRSGLRQDCDADCQQDFKYKRIASELLRDLRDTLGAVQAARVDALLIDVTQNGGGNSWESPASRQLTALPLPDLPGAFIRHPHWSQRLQEQRSVLEQDLRQKDLRPSDRRILVLAQKELDRRLEEATKPCDQTVLWSVPGARLGCTQLVQKRPLLSPLPEGALVGLPSLPLLFGDAQYTYSRGVYRGPLFVLVDERTASASEAFVSRLQGAGAAKILGKKTSGAGCGYTNGGVPIELPNLGLKISMPDCVRYRADGENEVLGLQPDVPISWGEKESPEERTVKLRAALEQLQLPKGHVAEEAARK